MMEADKSIKAVRLYTHLKPEYFEGLENFEVKEVELSEGSTGSSSPLKRAATSLLKLSSQGLGGSQRISKAMVKKNPLYLIPKPPLIPIGKKTYPTRTYIILPEDIDSFDPAITNSE